MLLSFLTFLCAILTGILLALMTYVSPKHQDKCQNLMLCVLIATIILWPCAFIHSKSWWPALLATVGIIGGIYLLMVIVLQPRHNRNVSRRP